MPKLRRFFRKSFRTIKKARIKNAVVDLRRNTGGSVNASTRLSQYMTDHPFKVADTVAAVSKSIKNKRYIHPWFYFWISINVAGRKRSDGRIHYQYFEKHVFKPRTRNHFDGNIYMLTGGYTFSASTLVLNNLMGQKNITIVGEETGGGAYGNTAIHIPDIVLPNTGVRVRLPLFRVVLDAQSVKKGRGVLPQIEVPPSSASIRMGIDAKMQKVKELIKSRRN